MNMEEEQLPEGWEVAPLEDVCEILDSQRIPINRVEREERIRGKQEDELFPYYGATGQVGVIDDFIFNGEYVLLGEDGAPFLDPLKDKAYLARGRFWVNNHAHILNSLISTKYLCYYLNQIDYSDYVTGTTRLKLNQSSLRRIPIQLAPAKQQQRIAAKIEELFSELDNGIQNMETARRQLSVYRQALLKQAFEGKLTTTWREQNKDKLETPEQLIARLENERQAQHNRQLTEWEAAVKAWRSGGKPGKKPAKPRTPQAVSFVSHDELPNLPRGWCWVRVADLCDVVRGGSPRPAGDLRYYEGSIPFLKVADLTRGSGVYVDSHSFTIKEAGLQKTRLVDPPILMLSNSGATLGVPKVCRIRTTFNDGIAAFLGLPENNLLYHYYFWTSKTLELRGINQGAAQPNLNTKLIGDVLIPVCSREEIQVVIKEIERALSTSDQLLAEIDKQLKKSDTLRQAILKAAFSGRLIKQDAGDEPVTVLLERIQAERSNVENKKRKTGT